MKTKTYIVTGKNGTDLRVLPSASSAFVRHLDCGAKVEVISEFTAVSTTDRSTHYFCIESDGQYHWAAAEDLSIEETKVNYLSRVASKAKSVYPLCIGKIHSGPDVSKVNSLKTLKAHKALSCNRMASITMQEAGLLDKGVVVGHTKKRSGKKTIDDAVSNWRKLRHCKVVWMNKKYADLPAEYKRAGCVYYQNSNACVSAGGGKIWSCNRSKGYKYKSKSDYYRSSGYPFTSRILVVVVPEH